MLDIDYQYVLSFIFTIDSMKYAKFTKKLFCNTYVIFVYIVNYTTVLKLIKTMGCFGVYLVNKYIL